MRLDKSDKVKHDVSQLIEYAFNKKNSIENTATFVSRYHHSDCYGIYIDNDLTSFIMSTYFEMMLFNAKIKISGIGYVSSYPEYRGQGSIKYLMQEVLERDFKQGIVVSQLAPFSEKFYTQFGYAYTSWQKTYRIPSFLFASVDTDSDVVTKRGTWEELKPDIMMCYNRYLLEGSQVGTISRESWWWNRLSEYYEDRKYVVVYDIDGQADGYMFYKIVGETFFIDELVYNTPHAIKSFLSFLKAHVSSCQEFAYSGSVEENLDSFFYESHQIDITIKPYMMSRIVNFPKLLEKLVYLNHDCVFEVTEDQFCPWNIGCWEKKENGCYEKTDKKSDIKASIHVWNELILGRLTLSEAMFLGKVSVKEHVDDFILKGKQNIYDYF